MSVPVLLLGPIFFEDFELPSSIAWGGAQSLTIHRLPGGARVIDAMGRDDADITWNGIFSGPDASARSRALDLMRVEGSFWPLTWDSFFYTVVVARFEADHQRSNWIPYRITCAVVQDEASALLERSLALTSSTAQDLAMAASFAPSVVPADLDAQLIASSDLRQTPGLAGLAAHQATASGYADRAARNARLESAGI